MATLTVTNTSDSHSIVQADIVRWKKNNTLMSGEQADDIVISPPVFALQPKQSQLLRIAWLANKTIHNQLTYRVILREIVPHQQSITLNSSSKLNIALAFSIPLFIQPPVVDTSCLFELNKINSKNSILRLINQGNITLLVSAYELIDNKKFFFGEKTFAYVLPKQEYVWRLTLPQRNVTHIKAMINGEWKQYSVQQKK